MICLCFAKRKDSGKNSLLLQTKCKSKVFETQRYKIYIIEIINDPNTNKLVHLSFANMINMINNKTKKLTATHAKD